MIRNDDCGLVRKHRCLDALFDEGAEAEIGFGAFAFTMGAWNRLF